MRPSDRYLLSMGEGSYWVNGTSKCGSIHWQYDVKVCLVRSCLRVFWSGLWTKKMHCPNPALGSTEIYGVEMPTVQRTEMCTSLTLFATTLTQNWTWR